ncbi:MAG: ATP-dependent helicase [Pseudomonadota bacterium]
MLEKLNPQQREVVETRSPCLAIACPGAGKTGTIATKAAVLLADPKVMVGAVTFSREAALELRSRILNLAGDGVKKRLLAGTFHSLAYKQVLGANSGPKIEIANEGDRFGLLDRVINELGLDLKVDAAIKIIENIKTDFGKVATGTPEEVLYKAYQAALKRNGKIDFQDMMGLAVAGMQAGTIKPYPVHHLLVDEFQDTDGPQFRWVSMHGKAGSIVTVVGDDDQSIYGFRSALGVRGMDAITEELQAQQIVLGINYRCRAEILTAADKVIRHNTLRIEKQLYADKGQGGTIESRRYKDEYDEATAAVTYLKPKLEANAECAILARTNRILDAVESVCRSYGVPYYRASGKSILNRPEGAVFCNLLEIIQGVKKTGLDAVLGMSGMGTADLTKLHEEMGATLVTRSKAELQNIGLDESTATAYRNFMKRLGEWKDLYSRNLQGLVLAGVGEWMLNTARSDQAQRSIQATHNVLSRLSGPFTDRIAFLRRDNNEPTPDALVLTTMHSAKGREWDHVWIVRAEDGVTPDDKSPESEERRLFYVGMTRAKETLQISSTKKGAVSRFVRESEIPAVQNPDLDEPAQ